MTTVLQVAHWTWKLIMIKKQIDTNSGYEENDETKEGQLRSHSNACFKSISLNKDKTGLHNPSRH